jgi:hypothetical protein
LATNKTRETNYRFRSENAILRITSPTVFQRRRFVTDRIEERNRLLFKTTSEARDRQYQCEVKLANLVVMEKSLQKEN